MPLRTQVFRVLLRPFSLAHLITLQRIGSNIVLGQPSTGIDLFASVHVCTLTWSECQEFAAEPEDWSRRFRDWMQRVGNCDLNSRATLFLEYVENGMRIPDHESFEPDGAQYRDIWTPSFHRMRVKLMQCLRLTDQEIMDRPLRLNWLDYLTIEEEAGNCRILTPEGIEFHKAAVEEHERILEALRN